jgi:hypothetical protein
VRRWLRCLSTGSGGPVCTAGKHARKMKKTKTDHTTGIQTAEGMKLSQSTDRQTERERRVESTREENVPTLCGWFTRLWVGFLCRCLFACFDMVRPKKVTSSDVCVYQIGRHYSAREWFQEGFVQQHSIFTPLIFSRVGQSFKGIPFVKQNSDHLLSSCPHSVSRLTSHPPTHTHPHPHPHIVSLSLSLVGCALLHTAQIHLSRHWFSSTP